ncbi:hypothetical protein BAUCODRAFT_426098 [Baudoinia panamericana UAMH 10762]|uniref:Uncharacterized protein n=1 Tax=Baudoinia panamericana (strain UAMH 10762) TaxID=717646 RepID=M2LUZ1_BAUPA|nr:uncharacterized protein BAUCODRAFT_426098 [Baudoinia panamericana UAMH 10762]EMC98432.1 hypothetical protein BAUCODRAFT_426098 [Baudoinia panamericana UAMH 10762]
MYKMRTLPLAAMRRRAKVLQYRLSLRLHNLIVSTYLFSIIACICKLCLFCTARDPLYRHCIRGPRSPIRCKTNLTNHVLPNATTCCVAGWRTSLHTKHFLWARSLTESLRKTPYVQRRHLVEARRA